MSCMGSFCLHISHQRVAPRICPNTVAFAALMEDNSEPWPILWKTVGRSLAKMFQKMQHGATPCLICLSCCNISQGRGLGIGIGLLTTFVDIFCNEAVLANTRSTSRMGCWHLQRSKKHWSWLTRISPIKFIRFMGVSDTSCFSVFYVNHDDLTIPSPQKGIPS